MSLVEKNIAIIEDDPKIVKFLTLCIQGLDWNVVKVASTLAEAVELAKELESLRVLYVLLDGNLSPRSRGGKDGGMIAQLLAKYAPGTKIIGISADQDQTYAHFQVGKGLDMYKLISAILNGEAGA